MEGNKRGRGRETDSGRKNRAPVEEELAEATQGLVFEDPFEDEFEDEEFEADDDDEVGEGEDDDAREEVPEDVPAEVRVFRPGIDALAPGEELEHDPSAYIMYHSLRAEWPCLSFDILRDTSGDNRLRFPLSMYIVCGSQADARDKNKLTLLKLSDMHKTHVALDSEGEEEDDDNLDEDPTIEHVNVPHVGGVNRVRSMPQNPGIIATMADNSHAHIFDTTAVFQGLMTRGHRPSAPTKPAFTFRGHRDEGFAVDWSPSRAGRLATGDCASAIHVWNMNGSSWQVDSAPYLGHMGSVEDLQWSPTEDTVFASASADRTIRVWDTRGRSGPQISVNAHAEDVNVISWNRGVSYLLASGSDDGSFKVWDLRAFREASPIAHFTHHKGPITSIEWAPNDDSSLAVSSADDQVTVWDLSVEADETPAGTVADYPPQLLFIHMGQTNVKELHFHPQIPGVILSTAEDGLNVFKPAIHVST